MIGWIATAFLLYGTFGIAKGLHWAPFAWRGIGDILWVVYGLQTGQWQIVVCELAFAWVDCRAAWQWYWCSREDR